MKILIAGASGLIGKELVSALSAAHSVSVVGRDMKHLQQVFPPNQNKITWETLDSIDAGQFDVIINLAGANIGAKRWTEQVKQSLITSRTQSNKRLIDWLTKYNAKPHFYCANAIGIYGTEGNEKTSFDESAAINKDTTHDFAKQICLEWEQSLQPAIDSGMKVTTLRFGVVLKKSDGMLKKLELPFSLGVGSVFGSGQQVISWVHHADVTDIITFLLAHPNITGPVNVTAPGPVTQKEFATEFAAVLKRPLLFTTPAFVVKAMFGEMGEQLILKGQRVIPTRLTEIGYTFKYPLLADALKKEYQA